MPIYEYYCPDNHRIYQFYAKTIAQGASIPRCPDQPDYRMVKMLSSFAVTAGGKKGERADAPVAAGAAAEDDPRLDAAMSAMESEFSSVDENDPRAMGRMMRRMAEMTGEKIDGEMEEVVRKLEEGADPESLEEQMAGEGAREVEGRQSEAADAPLPLELGEQSQGVRRRCGPPVHDPKLYDYDQESGI